MGMCTSKETLTPEEEEAKREEEEKAKEVEKQLKVDKEKFMREVKLLLLGAGECGKSTILKQMKLIYLDGFTDEEKKEEYLDLVHSNLLTNMGVLCQACMSLNVQMSPSDEAISARILDMLQSGALYGKEAHEAFMEVKDGIETLWTQSDAIKEVYERAAEFQMPDSTKYFNDDIQRIGDKDYVPNDQDILRSRMQTTAVVETAFVMDDKNFKVIDVGGQRNQREKWIHHFENVTSVIFIVGMSEYDQKLAEDESTNRMVEALSLFDDICNHKFFRKTAMLLFLNKMDMFIEKIKKVPLTVCFENYDGPQEADASSKFVQSAFIDLNNQPKEVYSHFTCATDTENIKVVLDVCKDVILQGALDEIGF